MKAENKTRTKQALETAAEMIRQHGENGMTPDEVGEETEEGLEEYGKACRRAFRLINTLANKYK